MRSLLIHCTECPASYHVHFEGEDPGALRCRDCGAQTIEISDIFSSHEYEEIDALEVRLWLDDDLLP